jgi:hypothetical protein
MPAIQKGRIPRRSIRRAQLHWYRQVFCHAVLRSSASLFEPNGLTLVQIDRSAYEEGPGPGPDIETNPNAILVFFVPSPRESQSAA